MTTTGAHARDVAIDGVDIRRADRSDVAAIELAHRDSIRSVGPAFYPPDVVDDWENSVSRDLYLQAMDRGEVFFIATGVVNGEPLVLGFSTDYAIEGSTHGTSVYVRGAAARAGIGSMLLRTAETCAIERGASTVEIEASLAGVTFYRAHGYVEIGRVDARLSTGCLVECITMRKEL